MPYDDEPLAIRTTRDHLLGGRIAFVQPAEGYRAAVDGLLLAAFAGGPTHHAFDLGAGAGMVSLAFAARRHEGRIIAVENDPQLAHCLRENVRANALDERVTVLLDDVLSVARSHRGTADLVLTNPPFYTSSTHTPAQRERARRAKSGHESRDPLDEFMKAARTLLGRRGRVCVVWPAIDLERLMQQASRVGLSARRLRAFHATSDSPARRALVEFVAGRPGGLAIEAPLVQFGADGNETPQFHAIVIES